MYAMFACYRAEMTDLPKVGTVEFDYIMDDSKTEPLFQQRMTLDLTSDKQYAVLG